MKKTILFLAALIAMATAALISCDKNANMSGSGAGVVINEDGSYDLAGTKWCGPNISEYTSGSSIGSTHYKYVSMDTILFKENNQFTYYGSENHMSWSDGSDESYSNAWRYSYEGHYVISGILFDLDMDKYAQYEDGKMIESGGRFITSGHLHVSNGKIDYICVQEKKLYPLQ